jgi:hypothetical protein
MTLYIFGTSVAMNKGGKPQHERNRSIIRLHKKGKSPTDIAAQFNVSPGRVYQIVARGATLEQRRAQLKKRYGERPKISELSDRTPVDVLILCDADIPGWAARVEQLRRASVPVKTLGDLRSVTDSQLLRIPKIGTRLLVRLRLFCPFRSYRPDRRKT